MSSIPSPESLARFSTRRPWLVVSAWVVLILGGLILSTTVGGVLTSSYTNSVATESARADKLVEERIYGTIPGRETVIVQSPEFTVDDPAFRAVVTDLAARLKGMPQSVAAVTTYYETGAPSLVSPDRRTTLIPVQLSGDRTDANERAAPIVDETRRLDGQGGFTVVTGGDGSIGTAFTDTAESDLQKAELLGIPIALLILVAVFGALGASWLPIALSLVSIVLAVGVTAVVGRAFEFSTFAINMITMMGLAVGIDYSLFVVQRFREERRRGLGRDDAIVTAGATASRSVLFSGITVVVALLGMLIVPDNLFRSLGAGAAFVVVVAVLAALTLLPAVLRLYGDRVDSVRIRIPGRRSAPSPAGSAFWARTTGVVIRHPVVSVVLSVGLLLAAAAPYASIRLGQAGVSSLPTDSVAHRAFSILNEQFSAGVIAPTEIAVDAPDVRDPAVGEAEQRLFTRLGQDPVFGQPSSRDASANDLTLITVPLTVDPQGEPAREAISRLRNEYIPAAFDGTAARALVTGATASGIDGTDVISDHTVTVFAFVLGMSFLVLLLVFRSIVVPLKAIVMNLLSVGAAYGLMVLVFQQGVGATLFGFQESPQIDAWIPLFMFAVLFGLSMDYHVFLLSRIRERFEHTRNNAESVAYGIQTTAGMITGAALIMVAVFAGFASGELVMFQQMGFGLAVAVLIDATIVRVVLVPASMELLGDRNWYLPSWLGWLPALNVDGAGAGRMPAAPAVPPAVGAREELSSHAG